MNNNKEIFSLIELSNEWNRSIDDLLILADKKELALLFRHADTREILFLPNIYSLDFSVTHGGKGFIDQPFMCANTAEKAKNIFDYDPVFYHGLKLEQIFTTAEQKERLEKWFNIEKHEKPLITTIPPKPQQEKNIYTDDSYGWKKSADDIAWDIIKYNRSKLTKKQLSVKVHKKMISLNNDGKEHMTGRGDHVPSSENILRNALKDIKL